MGIEVLSFHKIPLLDARLVAIILRACPKVHTIHIYDCPLINLGHVVCLLDLIWEVNEKRRRLDSQNLIVSFDFYPCYEKGMPYDTPAGTTYGLTWNPTNRELVQRGFFCLILKAYMKAKTMRLDMFSKGKAFVTFLNRIPNLPFAVPVFLEALERYLDLHPKESQTSQSRIKARYDLTIVMRVISPGGAWRRDSAQWLHRHQTPTYITCRSCQYKMLSDFFTRESRSPGAIEGLKVCAGCQLQVVMEGENCHGKAIKTNAINHLCPDWSPSGYNYDCPIPSKGHSLITLNGGQNSRLDELRRAQPQHKRSRDCLQNLPDLGDLVGHLVDDKPKYRARDAAADKAGKGKGIEQSSPDNNNRNNLFSDFHANCRSLDMYIRTLHLLREQYPETTGQCDAFGDHRVDCGLMDSADEPQLNCQAPASDPLSFNFKTAEECYFDLFPPTDPESRKEWEERKEREFW